MPDQVIYPMPEPSAHYFGDPWDAPAWEGATQVTTPIGGICPICRETIIDGDRGWMRGTIREVNGQPQGSVTPVHIECEALSVIGHMVGVCSCSGAKPGRASAVLAWSRLQELRKDERCPTTPFPQEQ